MDLMNVFQNVFPSVIKLSPSFGDAVHLQGSFVLRDKFVMELILNQSRTDGLICKEDKEFFVVSLTV
jgi:hypothetical protein